MVTVATGLDVPIKMLVPLVFPHGPTQSFTLIGLGDIVLPGLLVCFALRFDASREMEWKTGYFAGNSTHIPQLNSHATAALGGYTVGLILCEIVVGELHVAQPAMIYLVPGVLGALCLMAHRRGELQDLWVGIESTHARLEDDEEGGGGGYGDVDDLGRPRVY
mmetsp:Transcript_5382/g.11874  ORF Transcript_5382/g.11874 Transcript_5382/m.11874 type:complete len:163 (-) Transcript_5382:44-532(-)